MFGWYAYKKQNSQNEIERSYCVCYYKMYFTIER